MAYRTETERQARKAFSVQKRTAKRRGIEWQFTFDQWWAWWQVDGRWERRGHGMGKLQMARFNDDGPYHPENVYCATHEQNIRDIFITDEAREATGRETRAKWARGVDFRTVKGAAHFRSKPVETPAGRFVNATQAAQHFGFTRQYAALLARQGRNGWKWADETLPTS